jgi:hypothetical protein
MMKVKNLACLISVYLFFSCHRGKPFKLESSYYGGSFCAEELVYDYAKYKALNVLTDTLENFSNDDIEHIEMGQWDSGHGDIINNIKINFINHKIGITGYIGRYEPSNMLINKIKEVINTIPIQLLQLNRPPDNQHREYLDALSLKGKYQGVYEKAPIRYHEMRPTTTSRECSLYLTMMLKNGKSIAYSFSHDTVIQPWYARQWCENLSTAVQLTYKELNRGGFVVSVWNEHYLDITHRGELKLDTVNSNIEYCGGVKIQDKFPKFKFLIDLNTGENTIADLKINGKVQKDYIQKGEFRQFYDYKINRKNKGKVAEKMIIEYKINGSGYTKTINFDYQVYKAEKKD